MDAPYCFNAPRCVFLGGAIHWVRAATVGDLAILSGWLDDALPGRSERAVSPDITTPEAFEALDSLSGRAVLAWVALRRNGITFDQAEAIAAVASETEWNSLLAVLFERRRTKPARDQPSGDEPAWWGPLAAGIAERYGFTFDQISELTLDQIEVLGNDGCPTEAPGYITVGDVQRMWEAAQQDQPAAQTEEHPECP